LNWTEYRKWAHKIADWGANYRENLRDRPVRANTKPGDISNALPVAPPENGEPMENIFADFDNTIMPGMTHWQHPRFFAYFASNAAPPAVLAEFLISVVAAQCMLWQTSPAATELETRVLDWLRQALDLPDRFSGVIQDSASSATLAAVLTMREKALNWQGKTKGLAAHPAIRIYCSSEVHTSVDRAIWVAGIGEENLVKIPANGKRRSMDIDALQRAITADRDAGLIPAGIVACVGGTSVGGADNIKDVVALAKHEGLYTHIDAAWAGSAMICPEFRYFWDGVEGADSIVFNPHKWLGVPFDCSAHFIARPEELLDTLAIKPDYLKTHGRDGVINYSEWSIPLGRRFRALKLWFLLRAYGLSGLREMIRNHVKWSQELADKLTARPDFEITSTPMLSLFSFRYAPENVTDLDALNLQLLNKINDDGRIYLTQTTVDDKFVIRFQAGQFEMREDDAFVAYDTIIEIAKGLPR
jgi:aromatic-L-amino-acid decarboxylase